VLLAYNIEYCYRKDNISCTDKKYLDYLYKGVAVIEGKSFQDQYVQDLIKKCTLSKNLQFEYSHVKDKYSYYDIQNGMHVDTFYNCTKVFQYMNDVEAENGPFSYVLGSNLPNLNKLDFLFDASKYRTEAVKNGLTKEKNHELFTPSFRIKSKSHEADDISAALKKFNFTEETLITGPKGTIIIANVSGLHRKFPCQKNKIRITQRWRMKRRNPFNIGEYNYV